MLNNTFSLIDKLDFINKYNKSQINGIKNPASRKLVFDSIRGYKIIYLSCVNGNIVAITSNTRLICIYVKGESNGVICSNIFDFNIQYPLESLDEVHSLATDDSGKIVSRIQPVDIISLTKWISRSRITVDRIIVNDANNANDVNGMNHIEDIVLRVLTRSTCSNFNFMKLMLILDQARYSDIVDTSINVIHNTIANKELHTLARLRSIDHDMLLSVVKERDAKISKLIGDINKLNVNLQVANIRYIMDELSNSNIISNKTCNGNCRACRITKKIFVFVVGITLAVCYSFIILVLYLNM